ncbi:MAG: MIP/aquaporin family protein [Alphaproteobacteria bacterium]
MQTVVATMDNGHTVVHWSVTRRLAAEVLGTAFLLAVVIGSGQMGEDLSNGIAGLGLLANALATGAILAVLILMLGPVSGAHFNPAVTLSQWRLGTIPGRLALAYVAAQVVGGLVGAAVAQLMFDLPVLAASQVARSGSGLWLAEFVATFGLVATILGCIRFRPDAVAYAVGLYITAGYWFTASTSFANPAVTLARTLTTTGAGIRPEHAPAFMFVQVVAALSATIVCRWLFALQSPGGRASADVLD